ncbi:MAG: M1 family aminopeptidase [Polyangia bacterium]
MSAAHGGTRCRCHAGTRAGEAHAFALPGSSPYYVPDRVVAPTRIVIDVTIDLHRGWIGGRTTLTLSALRDGALEVSLDAVAMSIGSVAVDGVVVSHRYDGTGLSVTLGERRRGDVVTLTVEHEAEPEKGLYFIRPDAAYPGRPTEAWTQGQDEDNRHWFPCLDHPSWKCATEVRVRFPRELFALSNGDLIEDTTDGAQRTMHYRLDQPHSSYLVTLVVGTFATIEAQHGKVPLAYYVHPHRVDDAPRTFARTPEMMALFEQLTGRAYPFSRYSQIVVSEFIFGGMENTSATTLTDLTLHDERAHLDMTSEPLVAHELAHQWFGDLVTCRDWAHGWLNEGFATYFEHLWREHIAGSDEAAWDRLGDREQYLHEAKNRYVRPIVARIYDGPIDLFDRHLYEKGGAVLHMLRRELGDEPFWRGIKLYLDRHAGGVVETTDLQRALEEQSGVSLTRFFDQWLHRAGHPQLKVVYSWDESSRLARIDITQKEQKSEEVWALGLVVELVVGGVVQRHVLQLRETRELFHLPCASAPTQALVDPGMDLLAVIEVKKPDALWLTELTSAARGIDRLRAARALGKQAAHTSRAALVSAMQTDSFWATRAEAAKALGELRGLASRDALCTQLPLEESAKVRRAIVRALARFRHDLGAASTVALVLTEGDPSYLVEAEAATTLGKLRVPESFERLAAVIDRPSHRDVLSAAALAGLAALRDERGLPLALDRSRYGAPASARSAAISAAATLGAEHASRRRATREDLEELALDDPDFRARMAAVEGLGTLGDPEAAGTLDRVAAVDLDGRVKRHAREVQRDLADGRGPADQVKALRDRTDALEKSRDELRDRLANLEARLEPPKS